MISTFIIFLISLVTVIGWSILNFIKRKSDKLIFRRWFFNLSIFIFSFITIFIIYAINSFDTIYEKNNEWMINISLISYFLIYIFIFIIFIGLILFIPLKVYASVKYYKENSWALWKNIKMFLMFGTILIILSTLSYAFKQENVKLDSQFNTIVYNDSSSILNSYFILKDIVSYTVKSPWVGWVVIGYTITWIVICSFIVIKRPNYNIKDSIENKVSNILDFSKYIFPSFAFISIVSTFILSWQSFFLRILIIVLIGSLYTLINFIIGFFAKRKKEVNSYDSLYNFNKNIIIGMLLAIYLAISTNNNLSWVESGEHVNFWFSLYICSLLYSTIFIGINNTSFNRMGLCINTSYISSGINTLSLYFFNEIFEIFSITNAKIASKYFN